MTDSGRYLADALSQLLALGEIAASRLSTSRRVALEHYAHRTGAVVSQLRGNGRVFTVADRGAAELMLAQLRPLSPDEPHLDALPLRAANIGVRRHSKAGRHGHACYHLLIRPAGMGARWLDDNNGAFELTVAAAPTGIAALPIAPGDAWHTSGRLWLVENQALFDDLSWMPKDAHGTVAYYGGILDGRLLRWLASRRRHAGITLFPDYDGVGLHQYARLAATWPNKDVEFWLMPQWLQILARYGSARVWSNTRKHFEIASNRMQGTAALHRVAELMEAMQRLGLALEQESVWLAGKAAR